MSVVRGVVDRMLRRFGLAEPPEVSRLVAATDNTPQSLLAATDRLLRVSWAGSGKAPAAAAAALMVLALDTTGHELRARCVLHLQLAERTLSNLYGDLRLSDEVRHHLAAQTQHRRADDLVAVAATYPGGASQQPFAPADPIEHRVEALLATLPPDDLTRANLLAKLAHSSHIRYESMDTAALAEMWPRARAAFEAVIPGHVDAVAAGSIASLAGVTRFRADPGDRTAADIAVRAGRVALAGVESAARAGGLRDRHKIRTAHFSLAAALMCKIAVKAELQTIDEAIHHLEAFHAEGLPDDHGMYAGNKASLLAARGLVTWSVDDIARAEQLLAGLERDLPPDHPLLPHLAQKRAAIAKLKQMVRITPRAVGSLVTWLQPMVTPIAPPGPPMQFHSPMPPPGSRTRTAPPAPTPDPPVNRTPPETGPGPAATARGPLPQETVEVLRIVMQSPGAAQTVDPALVALSEDQLRAQLSAAAPGSGDHVEAAGLLMSVLSLRYQSDQDPGVIDEAVAIGEEALAQLAAGTPQHTRLLIVTTSLRHMRGVINHDVAGLQRACEELREALDRLPVDSPVRTMGELEYGDTLTALAGLTQNPGQAAGASRILAEATRRLESVPNATGILGQLRRIASRYTTWNDATEAYIRGDAQAIHAAEAALFDPARESDLMPVITIETARTALSDAIERRAWSDAADAATRALEALPLIISRALGRDDREAALSGALLGRRYPWAHLRTADGARGTAGLPDPTTGTSLSRTGCAAALAARRPAQALAILEQGRGVLMTQDLEARTDLTGVASAHPGLARDFTALSEMMRLADSLTTADPAGRVRFRHALAGEWEALVARIRSQPGFDRFLLPPTEAEMRAVASDGPIVVLNADRLRCDAILVTPEYIRCLPLPELTEGQLALRSAEFIAAVNLRRDAPAGKREHAREVIFDTLAWLWDTTAEPVLNALGFTGTIPDGHPPQEVQRLWWSASGPLAYLPLHAAGYQRKNQLGERRSVLDRVASSYTPTLRALRHARQAASSGTGGRPLAVVQPTGTSGSDGASAREIDDISKVLTDLHTLEREAATPEQVLSALHTASLVHFACHGVSDAESPSASHLALQGGNLSVVEISRQDLPYAELAVLLACYTAHADRLPDEAIHLVSAFQIAGYPQVVGALWEADDTASARLAGSFYHSLPRYGNGVDTTDAGRVLNGIVRDLRTRYARSPAVWAPYIHTGR